MKQSAILLQKMKRRVLSAPSSVEPMSKQSGRQQFLNWLQNTDPTLYSRTMTMVKARRRSNSLSNYDNSLGGIWDDIKGSLSAVLQTGLKLKQQRDLYKLQMARAERGFPPLKVDEFAPVIKTEIEIGQKTRNQLFSELGSGFKKYMIPAGIGLAALIFFMRR